MFKNHYLVLLLSLCMIACKSTKQANQINASDNLQNQNFLFPIDWVGQYVGDLNIYDGKSDSLQGKMKLIIDNPDGNGFYPWTIIYGDNDIRSYGLEAINPEKGHYRIDEYNSIKIDAYLRKNHFVSRFSVLESDLVVDYERVNNGIEVSFFISTERPVNISGDEIIAKDTIPLVGAFEILVVQNAFLKKI